MCSMTTRACEQPSLTAKLWRPSLLNFDSIELRVRLASPTKPKWPIKLERGPGK
jgi:hypothetical protein